MVNLTQYLYILSQLKNKTEQLTIGDLFDVPVDVMVEKDSDKKATCNENDKQNDNGKATIKLDDKGRTS